MVRYYNGERQIVDVPSSLRPALFNTFINDRVWTAVNCLLLLAHKNSGIT